MPVGCATKNSSDNAPEPGSGIVEYKEMTRQATSSIRSVVNSLDKVAAQAPPCPPKLSNDFSQQVLQLQVDSVRVRARTQTIEARGDAYFASWSESIARIKDPQVRANAERYRPELEQSFSKIKLASQQAGGAFKPFLSGLRLLRVQLEKGSGLPQDDATKELVRTTRAHGGEVLRQLGVIDEQLAAITTMLRGKTVASN
jgi:hypothetical protein